MHAAESVAVAIVCESIKMVVSLSEVQLRLCLLGLANSEQGSGLILVIKERVDLDVGNSLHLLVCEHFIDVLVERGSADSVQVLSNTDFFLSEAAELAVR